jgi:hypothetical protein
MVAHSIPVDAQTVDCGFTLGFRTIHDMIPDIVGNCRENEWHNAENGDGLQQTTGGLLVWRKLDNWTAFTNGSVTWINGPFGLQSRANTERFSWEGVAEVPAPPPPPVGGSDAGASATSTPVPAGATAPDITIRLSDGRVDNGETFNIRLESSSPVGIDRMWWWATSTNDNDLRDTHSENCHSTSPCVQSWDVSTTDDGDITFHGKSRDMDGVESEEVTQEIRVREKAEATATPTQTPTMTPNP